jgi:hypothetical protein
MSAHAAESGRAIGTPPGESEELRRRLAIQRAQFAQDHARRRRVAALRAQPRAARHGHPPVRPARRRALRARAGSSRTLTPGSSRVAIAAPRYRFCLRLSVKPAAVARDGGISNGRRVVNATRPRSAVACAGAWLPLVIPTPPSVCPNSLASLRQRRCSTCLGSQGRTVDVVPMHRKQRVRPVALLVVVRSVSRGAEWVWHSLRQVKRKSILVLASFGASSDLGVKFIEGDGR